MSALKKLGLGFFAATAITGAITMSPAIEVAEAKNNHHKEVKVNKHIIVHKEVHEHHDGGNFWETLGAVTAGTIVGNVMSNAINSNRQVVVVDQQPQVVVVQQQPILQPCNVPQRYTDHEGFIHHRYVDMCGTPHDDIVGSIYDVACGGF